MIKLPKKNVALIFLIIVVLTAAFWRFANFEQRIVFNQDQARDATVALYSINHGILPLIGPPSSAGPFNFGPLYYWVIIFFILLAPFSYLTPWIGFTLLSVLEVIFIFLAAEKIFGKGFALLAGVVAAFASRDIINATDMLNPMLVGVATAGVIFCLVKLVKEGKIFYSLLLGLFVGLAINFHFQALGLVSILILSSLINNFNIRKKMISSFLMLAGLFIAFLPLIYFDLINKGLWVKSILNYLMIGQNKFYIPIRWLTEIRDFWPKLWGDVITNNQPMGYFFVAIFLIAVFLAVRRKKYISVSLIIIFISFLFQMIMLRYYKGPRLTVYLIVYFPFLIFFTAWSLWVILQTRRILGIVLILISLAFSSYSNFHIIYSFGQAPDITFLKNELVSKEKGKIDLYQFRSSGMLSLPTLYLLERENRIDFRGRKIGVCETYPQEGIYDQIGADCPKDLNILIRKGRYIVYDFNYLNDQNIKKAGFERLSSPQVYDSIFVNFPQLTEYN